MTFLSHNWPQGVSEEGRARASTVLAFGCTGYAYDDAANSFAKCSGTKASLVRRTIASGSVVVYLQCDSCGKAMGGALKREHHQNWQSYPEWDDDLVVNQRGAADQYFQENREQFDRDREKALEDRVVASNKWWRLYNVYLTTPLWRTRSGIVISRANGLCEGCGFRPATQAHHKQYPRECDPGSEEWIRKEKLFDLVAVCARCHEDIHS